jgi:DNA-binding PadR family transcriptional regulator
MCSDSLGAIQAALKKLLSKGLVSVEEVHEGGKAKKVFSITDQGRKEYSAWITNPMDLTRQKNPELAKLLLLGLAPAKDRPALIEQAIETMQAELDTLLALQSYLDVARDKAALLDYFEEDAEYAQGLLDSIESTDLDKSLDDLIKYQMLTLQFGIDNCRFQIEWMKENLSA